MTLSIKILGSGCRNCVTLDRITRQAISDLALDADVAKVEDYATITSYGVMSTPALVIDEQVVTVGRVPTPTILRHLLASAADAAAHEAHDPPTGRNRHDHQGPRTRLRQLPTPGSPHPGSAR